MLVLPERPVLNGLELLSQGPFGGLLDVEVDGGVDPETAGVELGAVPRVELTYSTKYGATSLKSDREESSSGYAFQRSASVSDRRPASVIRLRMRFRR
jgi:hypothetical protein